MKQTFISVTPINSPYITPYGRAHSIGTVSNVVARSEKEVGRNSYTGGNDLGMSKEQVI
jgi:hypothetical protein